MAKITNLDEILFPDKQVKLKGRVFTLPGDMPVELWLRIQSVGDQELNDQELITYLHGELLKLFRYGDPDLKELPIGVKEVMLVIPAIYGGAADSDDESGELPTTVKTRGASGAKARRPRSQSGS